MGTFRIEIVGTGPHGSRQPGDADEIARLFAKQLRDAGHAVHAAGFATADGEAWNVPDGILAPEQISPAPEPTQPVARASRADIPGVSGFRAKPAE